MLVFGWETFQFSHCHFDPRCGEKPNFGVLIEACEVHGEACEVLREASQVLEEACKVLGEACKVLEEACKVLREACQVLGEACQVLGEACQVLGEDCQVLREGFQVLKGTNLWKSIWLTVGVLVIERSRNHKLPIVASAIAQPAGLRLSLSQPIG